MSGVSNVEIAPTEMVCGEQAPRAAAVEILTPREVPLGGPRAMSVRRTLPQRQRSLIGAWCFVDHYGPDDVAATGGMDVAPHPHTGPAPVRSAAAVGPRSAMAPAFGRPPAGLRWRPTRLSPAAPTPAPPPATRLVISGAVSGSVAGATAAGPCGVAAGGGLGAELRFQIQGRPWALALSLPSYGAPGDYALPPNRISLHTLGIDASAQFFGSLKGSVTVAAGGASGTLDADLVGDGGNAHVTGAWSCAG